MPIYSPLSTVLRSAELPLTAAAVIAAEGQALVSTMVAGVPGVAPSAGTSGEKFAGFVNTQTSAASFLQTTAVAVEQFVLPSGKTMTLGKSPVASTTLVRNSATGAIVASDSVTGAVVDMTTNGVAGTTYDVTYRYTLTVPQSRARQGDTTPGGYAGLTTGTVSVLQAGTIYTDQFSTLADFGPAAEKVVLAANGQLTSLTINSSGTVISGAVRALPSVDFPWLGIEFDVY